VSFSGNAVHYDTERGVGFADGNLLFDGTDGTMTVGDNAGGMGFRVRDWTGGFNRLEMNMEGNGGMRIQSQDLSTLSLGSADDQKIFHHNGNSSISADGGTSSAKGYYKWSNADSEFKFLA